jgi:hypothetical protein
VARFLTVAAASLLATGAFAQSDITVETLEPAPEAAEAATEEPLLNQPSVAQPDAASGTAALLRGLDKVNGQTVDVEIPLGASATVFGLEVLADDCRFPVDNPTGDAYALLNVKDSRTGATVFEGWMIASSPALNALDHNRYDVWVLRCSNS